MDLEMTGNNTDLEVDVFILGAGPAGCCAALHLAPFFSTLLIDRSATPQPRAGESLPPAANPLLRDMGLLEELQDQGHLPYYGNQSRWGSEALQEVDFLRNPQGHGWHLDRQQFETWLRQKAVERGATLLAPAYLVHVEREPPRGWRVIVQQGERRLSLQARLLLDAGGRTPVLARRLGAARLRLDDLVCGWVIASAQSDPSHPGFSYIQAASQGWWYTAPIPGGRQILAFHTRAGHAATNWIHSPQPLLEQARLLPALWERIHFEEQDLCQWQHGTTAAHSAVTQPAAGHAWLSVGDAALSFDPLSSQGILNALYTGLAAAESGYRFLQGAIADFAEYQAQLDQIRSVYERHLHEYYRLEQRWSHEAFWKGR